MSTVPQLLICEVIEHWDPPLFGYDRLHSHKTNLQFVENRHWVKGVYGHHVSACFGHGATRDASKLENNS